MTFRFAAANDPVRLAGRRATGRGLVTRAEQQSGNDNRCAGPVDFDPMLIAALRHFAAHGLGAVEAAAANAALAEMSCDPELRDHWLEVTRMFDRRRAARAGTATTPV